MEASKFLVQSTCENTLEYHPYITSSRRVPNRDSTAVCSLQFAVASIGHNTPLQRERKLEKEYVERRWFRKNKGLMLDSPNVSKFTDWPDTSALSMRLETPDEESKRPGDHRDSVPKISILVIWHESIVFIETLSSSRNE